MISGKRAKIRACWSKLFHFWCPDWSLFKSLDQSLWVVWHIHGKPKLLLVLLRQTRPLHTCHYWILPCFLQNVHSISFCELNGKRETLLYYCVDYVVKQKSENGKVGHQVNGRRNLIFYTPQNRGWKLNNWTSVIHYSLGVAFNYSL